MAIRAWVVHGVVVAGVWGWGFAAAPGGDATAVRLGVQSRHVGLMGRVRSGTWMPLLVELENPTDNPRRLRCQWIVPDADGDPVHAQRRVSLGPGSVARLWLYAMAPALTGGGGSATWPVRVIDDDHHENLTAHTVGPLEWIDPRVGVVGLTGSALLGLGPYASHATRHERRQFLTGIDPAQLPDRWYGLSLLGALVWTPEGGDPGSPSISVGTRGAIRQWVHRGGHLVVVLSDVGDPWFDSPLGSLLPPVRVERVTADGPPGWLGQPRVKIDDPIHMKALWPRRGRGVSVLFQDAVGRPLVVAHRYGWGRVTVIGIELSDPRLIRGDLPNGPDLWSGVFGWRGPGYPEDHVKEELGQQRMTQAQFRRRFELDRFIARRIAMRQTVAPALLAALILFGVYWLVAGPIGFALLKKRGQTQHSWLAFLAVVLVASGVAWASAWWLGPKQASVAHFTVMDVTWKGDLLRAQSWLSLFVPRHGHASVVVGWDEEDAKAGHTLSSPVLGAGGGGFLDPQGYTVEAARPHQARLPLRATAKQLQVNWFSRVREGDRRAWAVSNEPLRVVDGYPSGVLTHQLSSPVHNLLVVYCPGHGHTPRVWRRLGPWRPHEPMTLGRPDQDIALIQAYEDESNRVWKHEGYLGRLVGVKTGQTWAADDDAGVDIASSEIVQAIEMLSFYDTLPPPDFRNTNPMNRAANYDRRLGRVMDLTPLTQLPCVMLIGHLEQAPLPVPLSVDAKAVATSGWTVVRWVGTLEGQGSP